jgi:hypothetical protein
MRKQDKQLSLDGCANQSRPGQEQSWEGYESFSAAILKSEDD